MREKDLQIKVRSVLEDLGYVIWFAPAFSKFRWDVFGIFDIVAVSKIKNDVQFIQITTISHLSHRRRKIKDFFEQNDIEIKNSWVFAYDEKRDNWKMEKIIRFGNSNDYF